MTRNAILTRRNLPSVCGLCGLIPCNRICVIRACKKRRMLLWEGGLSLSAMRRRIHPPRHPPFSSGSRVPQRGQFLAPRLFRTAPGRNLSVSDGPLRDFHFYRVTRMDFRGNTDAERRSMERKWHKGMFWTMSTEPLCKPSSA